MVLPLLARFGFGELAFLDEMFRDFANVSKSEIEQQRSSGCKFSRRSHLCALRKTHEKRLFSASFPMIAVDAFDPKQVATHFT